MKKKKRSKPTGTRTARNPVYIMRDLVQILNDEKGTPIGSQRVREYKPRTIRDGDCSLLKGLDTVIGVTDQGPQQIPMSWNFPVGMSVDEAFREFVKYKDIEFERMKAENQKAIDEAEAAAKAKGGIVGVDGRPVKERPAGIIGLDGKPIADVPPEPEDPDAEVTSPFSEKEKVSDESSGE